MLELSADPWQWPDLDQEQFVELSKGAARGGPTAPLFQYVAVRRCNALKPEIEAGSGFAVLAAVRICGTHGLVMPLWLVFAFNRRYDAVLNCRAASWDDPESFGRPYKKGSQLSAMRKARTLRFAVLNAVGDILSKTPDTPIDKQLFEQVGGPLAIGATLATEYYYQAKKIIGAWPSQNAEKPKRGRRVIENLTKIPKVAGLRKSRR